MCVWLDVESKLIADEPFGVVAYRVIAGTHDLSAEKFVNYTSMHLKKL